MFASDGQITSGMIRSFGRKIYPLNDRCLWSASGELALIQRVQERLKRLPNAPLVNLRDSIGQILTECVGELLGMDFRTRFLPQDPNVLLQLHPGDFVFAEASPRPCILHVLAHGTPEWIEGRAFATGSGEPFAYALLQKYQGQQLNLEQASLLAYKVINEAIEVGAYGLGPPIDIWHLLGNGMRQLGEEKMAALGDAYRVLREGEIQSLLRGGILNESSS